MEEERSFDLRDFWTIIKKRRALILGITAIVVVVTGILCFLILSPVYQSKTTIIIGNAPDQSNSNGRSNSDDIYMYQKLMKTYAGIAKSDLIAQKVADDFGEPEMLKNIQDNLTVTPQADTQILELKFNSKDQQKVEKVLNSIADTFIEESQLKYPTDNIKVLDKAKVPEAPIKPKKVFNVVIAFFIGLIGSVAMVFLLEYMDGTIKNEDDAEKYLRLPIIGLIPKNTNKKS